MNKSNWPNYNMLIKCHKISKGCFSTERIVEIHDAFRGPIEVFVDIETQLVDSKYLKVEEIQID